MLDIQPIKARLTAATPGRWYREVTGVAHRGIRTENTWLFADDGATEADAELVACAKEYLAALVAEVERLRKEDEENINRIRELQERNDSLSDENIRLSNQRHIRVAAPPSIIEKLNAKIEQLENEIAVMQQVTLKGLVAEIGQLKVELDKYKTALQKLFSVTPTTNNMPRELYYLKGFKENHEEALKLAKELLWAKNDQI